MLFSAAMNPSLQRQQEPFTIVLYLTIFFFSFIAIIIFSLRNRIFWCHCHICEAYRTSSWMSEFKNLCDWYTHLLKISPTQTIHIHVLKNTITANPSVVEHILRTRFENYPKGKPFSRILGDLLGKGIFNVDGNLWAFQRKHASVELGSVSIRTYAFEIVRKEIEHRFLPLLRSREFEVLDLQEIFQRFSFDNVCNFSFGFDPGCLELSLPMSRFDESFDLATRLSAERALVVSPLIWRMKRLLNIGSERRLREAVMVVRALAKEVILNKRTLGFSAHQDLLSRFMTCMNDDEFLRDIVVSFVLAGRDTMASALTTFFWLLGNHPDVVSRTRKEADDQAIKVDRKKENNGLGVWNLERLRKMHYLHAAIYEGLRLYPPIQFDSKFALEDDILPDGTFVQNGTRVTYHPYAMGRMEHIWGADCIEFNPNRWLKNGSFCPQNLFKYPVFQAGARVCLGKEMAIVEMKIVVLSVIQEFNIEVVEPATEPRFSPGLTAFVRGGLKVVMKRRDSSTFEDKQN